MSNTSWKPFILDPWNLTFLGFAAGLGSMMCTSSAELWLLSLVLGMIVMLQFGFWFAWRETVRAFQPQSPEEAAWLQRMDKEIWEPRRERRRRRRRKDTGQ